MLMSDQNSEISRREVLKSASGSVVAAGGLTGLSSSGAASQGEVEEKSIEGTDKKESIEATHQEPRVRSLLSVLGFPDIDDSASSVRKIQSGEITIISVKLVTEVGPIEFAKYGKSELNNIEAIFKLSDDVDHSSLHINVPDNDVLLIGESNGVVLSRKATKQEQ